MGKLVGPSVRIISLQLRGAGGVTLLGRLPRQERVDHFRMRLRIGPLFRDPSPFGSQAFPVNIGVLDDQSLGPLRMPENYPEADRTSIVVKIEGVVVEPQHFEKMNDR